MSDLLEIHDLSVSYGAVNALRGVSLNAEKGQVTGLIGPNGAGKTSLLTAIVRAVPWAGGDILFNGTSLKGEKPETVVRKGVSMVPESREIFTKLTVRENLLIGASIRNDGPGILRDIDRMLDLFPRLAERIESAAGTLSGGEQQMLAIGRALMSEPTMLLLDEPSLGLAPVVTDKVYEVIENLKRAEVTVLLVEQNARRALSVCDKLYLMAAGKIEFTGTAAELAKGGGVESAYFGTDLLEKDQDTSTQRGGS